MYSSDFDATPADSYKGSGKEGVDIQWFVFNKFGKLSKKWTEMQ